MTGNRCHVTILFFLLCLLNYSVKGNAIVKVPNDKSTNTAAPVASETHEPVQLKTTDKSISPVSTVTKAVGDITIPPTLEPSTVPSDPDLPPTTPTTTTASTPITTPTTASTTVSTTSKTTPAPPPPTTTTTKPTTSTANPITSSTTGSSTSTTTSAPTTAIPHPSRQFDGPSFIGGIVLASGLMAIGFVAFKFYKARTERNYHTL